MSLERIVGFSRTTCDIRFMTLSDQNDRSPTKLPPKDPKYDENEANSIRSQRRKTHPLLRQKPSAKRCPQLLQGNNKDEPSPARTYDELLREASEVITIGDLPSTILRVSRQRTPSIASRVDLISASCFLHSGSVHQMAKLPPAKRNARSAKYQVAEEDQHKQPSAVAPPESLTKPSLMFKLPLQGKCFKGEVFRFEDPQLASNCNTNSTSASSSTLGEPQTPNAMIPDLPRPVKRRQSAVRGDPSLSRSPCFGADSGGDLDKSFGSTCSSVNSSLNASQAYCPTPTSTKSITRRRSAHYSSWVRSHGTFVPVTAKPKTGCSSRSPTPGLGKCEETDEIRAEDLAEARPGPLKEVASDQTLALNCPTLDGSPKETRIATSVDPTTRDEDIIRPVLPSIISATTTSPPKKSTPKSLPKASSLLPNDDESIEDEKTEPLEPCGKSRSLMIEGSDSQKQNVEVSQECQPLVSVTGRTGGPTVVTSPQQQEPERDILQIKMDAVNRIAALLNAFK